jgi:hypothetical protein
VVECNACLEEIDDATDTRVEVVKPMRWKGEVREVRHFYCSVGCLVDELGD